MRAEADTAFWRTLALQEANLAYSVKKNEAGENVYTYGTEKIPTGMMFSSDMYNTDGSLKSKEQISEKTVKIDPDTGVATYNVPKFQGLDPNFATDPKDMKQFKGQEESGIKSIFRTEEFTQKDPDTGLDKTYITSAYDPSKESPGSSAVFDPFGLKGTKDQSVLGGKWVLKRNIWSEIPAGAHSVDSKTVAQWEGGYSDIPTKMAPEAPRTWDPKTGEQESGPKEAPYGKGIVPIATPISGELTSLKESQLALTAKTGETTYNPDGTISTMMKMPSVESAEYWSKVGGVIDKPVDEYSGNILIGKTTEKVHPDPVYITDREAELKMLYSDQGLSIPWHEPKREVIQMDDGVLSIIPYKMDPQRPVYQTLHPDVLQPDYVQPEQPQAVAPEPYEVPYYVDIPKATEMLQSGMTIEQIMERPPLDSEYMYWTDPYDKKEYVMSHDEHQEYLTELVKQKKIEKRRKYEDIFMDVTPSMRGARVPKGSSRAGPSITRTRMGSNAAPPEADIGGLVR